MFQATSHWISEQLFDRLAVYFRRQLESGLQEIQITRGHEMTLGNILNEPPRALCLNVQAWSDENNAQSSILKLDNCKQFLKHISMSIIVVSTVLIFEFITDWFEARKKRVFIVPVRYQEPKRLLNPEDSVQWLQVQKQRMMIIQKLREEAKQLEIS